MRIIIASDHAGYLLKQVVKNWLEKHDYEVIDIGVDSAEVPVDYPEYALKVASAVSLGEFERGILVCGSGQGMAMAANRLPGVRAAVCHDKLTAHQSRAHNNANILCLGERVVPPQWILPILETWFNTDFEGGVHTRRIAQIERGYLPFSQAQTTSLPKDYQRFRFGAALSPNRTKFAPILFAGALEEGIEAVAKTGFNAIELSIRSAEDIHSQVLSQALAQRRLSLSAFATGQACIEDDLCLCSTDQDVVIKTVGRLKGIIELAAQFQAAAIIGGIRGRLTGDKCDQERQREAAVQAIRECARFANSKGIMLLIEPINRYETNFINTSWEGIALIEEVNEPNLKLLLDIYHMNIEEGNLQQALWMSQEHLGYVHIADNNRRAPGQGHISFEQIFRTLEQIGYQGYITAEILPLPDDRTAILQTATFLKLLNQPLD